MPLFTVYWAEYVLQAGAWTAFSLEVGKENSQHERELAYSYMNLCYQIGVFASRSSALWVSAKSLSTLWVMPLVQCGLLALFTVEAATGHPLALEGAGLLAPAALAGLLGGAVYVNAFVMINRDVAPERREFALGAVAVADSMGILIADVMSLWWQWCLFKAGGKDLADQADGKCPF